MVICNKLITPDGTVLRSMHRHDMIIYNDKNGKTYMIDGAGDYCRSSANGDEIFIQITTNDPWKVIREEVVRWNNYSSSYVKLKDMSDTWLQNVLDYLSLHGHTGAYFRLYLEEKLYRAENFIYISEEENYKLDYAA